MIVVRVFCNKEGKMTDKNQIKADVVLLDTFRSRTERSSSLSHASFIPTGSGVTPLSDTSQRVQAREDNIVSDVVVLSDGTKISKKTFFYVVPYLMDLKKSSPALLSELASAVYFQDMQKFLSQNTLGQVGFDIGYGQIGRLTDLRPREVEIEEIVAEAITVVDEQEALTLNLESLVSYLDPVDVVRMNDFYTREKPRNSISILAM